MKKGIRIILDDSGNEKIVDLQAKKKPEKFCAVPISKSANIPVDIPVAKITQEPWPEDIRRQCERIAEQHQRGKGV